MSVHTYNICVSIPGILVDNYTTIVNHTMALINGLQLKLSTFLGKMLGEEKTPAIEVKDKLLHNDNQTKDIEQTEQAESATLATTSDKKGDIFIDAALEDIDLAQEIAAYLEHNHFFYRPPIDVSASSAEIRKTFEQNLLSCHAVIVLADKVPMVWVQEHLRYYRRIVARRSQPLKLIAVYGSHSPSLNRVYLPNTEIIYCSTQDCLDHLMEVLQK